MDSKVADHHDNGEHEHLPLHSNADLHESYPTDSFNGDLHHHLPSPDPVASKHADLSAEIERSIADNQVLVDEIASLRNAGVAMEHTREILQRELLGSSQRAEDFSADITSLEVEKSKHKDLAACMAQEVHALHAEKMDLQDENGNIASEIKSLDAILTETKERSSLLARDVDEKQTAMAAAQTRVHMICFEVEKLQLEKEEYLKEVSLLDATNGAIDSQISQSREEEKALSNEVDQIVIAKTLAEQKVSNAQASIVALREQVSTSTESDEDMQNKLGEAMERLRHLEEEDKAMALRDRDIIADLESRVHTLRANCDTTEQASEQEKEASSRALEVTHMKVAPAEREMYVLELPSDVKQQHVQDLQCQVSDLREEKEALARSNEELQAEIRKTREKPVAENSIQCQVSNLREEKEALARSSEELQAELRKTHEKPVSENSIQLKEDVKQLECALNETEERAHLSESKEIELKCKLQELTILVKSKTRFAGLATPLMISGGTIVALGLLVYLLRSNAKSK